MKLVMGKGDWPDFVGFWNPDACAYDIRQGDTLRFCASRETDEAVPTPVREFAMAGTCRRR